MLVTGLPGISLPASETCPADARAGCDLCPAQPTRVAAYAALADRLRARDPVPEFGLATCRSCPTGPPAAYAPAGPLIFAAQAKVPASREQRLEILRTLAVLPDAVIKVRATGHERQTHDEDFPYRCWPSNYRSGPSGSPTDR